MAAQHFLVPTDFSPHADQALTKAIELAKALNARLTLLHVLHITPLTVGEVPPTYLNQYQADLEIDAEHHLQTALDRVHAAGLQGEYVISNGPPYLTIVDTAADMKVDLVILGTHGRTGLTHALMGSVAEKVVRLAPCPVLVTRQQQAATSA
ncbi:MAG: hypothetical protein ETSY1_32245 [Candidatus Entotheonella factor]|uniref:Universal stress protein n=1 Tax=Entotheonella factor TaxID=1429438 RepID=W4LBD0_ENTF1|nr:universal stress protein [Candidatus Entotheonella palauensis]ETW95045.1 MAG: hypothetical protein ETSY1_32245 [Candidatus Entotheonella factor]